MITRQVREIKAREDDIRVAKKKLDNFERFASAAAPASGSAVQLSRQQVRLEYSVKLNLSEQILTISSIELFFMTSQLTTAYQQIPFFQEICTAAQLNQGKLLRSLYP